MSVSIPSTPSAYIKQFLPVVPGRPESAPAFAKLREVVVMPVIAACVESATRCNCYTQQGSLITDMTKESCSDYLHTGVHFNPYAKSAESIAVAPVVHAPLQNASGGSVAPSAGRGGSAGSDALYGVPERSTVAEDRTRILPPVPAS